MEKIVFQFVEKIGIIKQILETNLHIKTLKNKIHPRIVKYKISNYMDQIKDLQIDARTIEQLLIM